MKTRILAAAGAIAVAGVVALGVSGTANAMTPAPAASQADCNSAASATATAQSNFNNALSVAIARAKELGFTSDQVNLAQQILAQGNITAAQQAQLTMVYSEHASMVNLAADLAKVKAVVDLRFALSAAQAAQNVSCTGFTPAVAAPAVTPGAIPAPVYTVPSGAPAAGDGSSLAGN